MTLDEGLVKWEQQREEKESEGLWSWAEALKLAQEGRKTSEV